jgi:hypothetical protein
MNKKIKKLNREQLANKKAEGLERKALNALSRFNFGSAFGHWAKAQEVRANKGKVIKIKKAAKKGKVKIAA